MSYHVALNAFTLSPSCEGSSSSGMHAHSVAAQESPKWSSALQLAVERPKRRSRHRGRGNRLAKACSVQEWAGLPQNPQNADLVGNTSFLDYTSPKSPLIPDAGSEWNTDTGATCHMTPHRHWFNSYTPHRTQIRLANNQTIYSVGIGSVVFQPLINGKPGRLLEFHRVLHIPELRNNLLSVLYLTQEKSYTVTIKKDKLQFRQNGTLLFTASVKPTFAAFLDGQVVPMTHFAGATSTCSMDFTLWHRRFAHLNHPDVRKVYNESLVKGMVLKSKLLPDPICEPCIAGKQHRSNVSKHSSSRSTELLQLIHSDVHGVKLALSWFTPSFLICWWR